MSKRITKISDEELESKEAELRQCYEKCLEGLDVGGTVSVCEAKHVRLIGSLWHHAHELLKARRDEEAENDKAVMTAETMELKASGLRSVK